MSEYYGISTPTESYLAHYGVKGMKWGIRRALRSGNSEKLRKHYAKAYKKYEKLTNKANIPVAANNAYAYRSLARGFGGLTGVQGGLSAALIAKEGTKALPISAFATGPVAVPTALFGVSYLKNKKRLSSKGHAKAIDKIKKWENAMNGAFKGTKYEKAAKQKYKDEYELTDLKKGKNGYYEKSVAKIKGSHLTSDYKGKDKQKFLDLATKVPKSAFRKDGDGIAIQARALNVNNRSLSTKMDADPLAFNYNYRMVTRKHKDPKVPVHMSSNELYWEHHRNKHK